MKSRLLMVLSLALPPALGVTAAQAIEERLADHRALERCIVWGGTVRSLGPDKVACCLEHTCVICTTDSCVVRTTITEGRFDPGLGGGANGGTFDSQAPVKALPLGN